MVSHDNVMSDHPFIQALLLKLGIDPDTTKACNISIGPGPVEVWRIDGALKPEGCGGIKPEAEFTPGLADPAGAS